MFILALLFPKMFSFCFRLPKNSISSNRLFSFYSPGQIRKEKVIWD